MLRAGSLRQKEVINIADGKRLGFVGDVEINFAEGAIDAIIIPGPGRFYGLFGKPEEHIIPWKNIVRVGDDIILVEYEKASLKT